MIRLFDVQVYGLLSVHKDQLSPSRIVMQVDEAGMFSVANVHLRQDNAMDPASDWVSQMHTTVADDIAFVHANPLYNNSCAGKGACPDRHWSCPYILSSLFGGSHVARRTNRRIFLITPGILLCCVILATSCHKHATNMLFLKASCACFPETYY